MWTVEGRICGNCLAPFMREVGRLLAWEELKSSAALCEYAGGMVKNWQTR